MCLDRLAKFEVKEKIGWKIFNKKNHGLHSAVGRGPAIKIGQWVNEVAYRPGGRKNQKYIHINEKRKYLLGWHIWTEKPIWAHLSKYECFRPVKFRKVVTTGFWGQRRIIVAKEIYIIPFKEIKKCMKGKK